MPQAPNALPPRFNPFGFACVAALAAFALGVLFTPSTTIESWKLYCEDRWLLLAGAVLLALCGAMPRARAALPSFKWPAALILAAIMAIACAAGHHWLLCDYDLTRDEQMATFDATVFASGHLTARLPALWADHASTLNTLFMYPAVHRGAWISSYLPLNAGLRALMGVYTGPLMTALGAIALWGVARRLWPDDAEAAVVALLLYAGSGQVLGAGMTSYAMPAHLALNTCWLWLYLQRRLPADLGALVVAFVATGLHQPLMHPMFAAPFMILLLIERRFDRLALYALGYAAIGAFWLYWPVATWPTVQTDAHALRPASVDFLTRLVDTVRAGDPYSIKKMAANLLRFVAWQHLALVPLMLVGARLRYTDRMVAALLGGVVLVIAVMTIILPSQGFGFGYRYLHGMIANCILLAVFGWRSLADKSTRWRSWFLRATAATLCVIMPLQAWAAHASYAPEAGVSAQIDHIDADYAVIGALDTPLSGEYPTITLSLVANPPWLDRRPIRLLRESLDPATITAICASHPSVVFVGDPTLKPIATYYQITGEHAAAPNRLFASRMGSAGCRVHG